MSKLYFLVPDERIATNVVADLVAKGMPEEAIGVVARDPVSSRSLPEAEISDTSDFKPAVSQGAIIGGGTGLLGGLAMTVVPGGFAAGGAALAGITLAGGAFGAWVSGMVGVSVPNREIVEFEAAIEDGALLMIVEVADDKREVIKKTVTGRHPKVVFGGQSGGLLLAVGS